MTLSIDLVYPPSVTGSGNYACEPPLGPLALYASLPPRLRDGVRFLDGTLLDQPDIDQALAARPADIVALSCTTYNYPNALELAHAARARGAVVIAGGIHITHLCAQISDLMCAGRRPFDYLLYGSAEPGWTALISSLERGDLPSADIPGLVRIADGKVRTTAPLLSRWHIDPLPTPLDFTPLDLHSYFRRFQRLGRLCDVRLAAPLFTQRGCVYGGDHKCLFCSIEQINPKVPVDLIKANLLHLVRDFGVDHIRLSDADFTASPRHMAGVAHAAEAVSKVTGVRPSFYCFARADEIDATRVALLRRMNCIAVFIGYESGSDRMLAAMQKHTTRAQNLRATELLAAAGIDVTCAGLVLGGPGEDAVSLAETLAFARQLTMFDNVRSLVATPLIPLPGSLAFRRLSARLGVQEEPPCVGADLFDPAGLAEAWCKAMCSVSFAELLQVADEIAALIPTGIRLVRFNHQTEGRYREELLNV